MDSSTHTANVYLLNIYSIMQQHTSNPMQMELTNISMCHQREPHYAGVPVIDGASPFS